MRWLLVAAALAGCTGGPRLGANVSTDGSGLDLRTSLSGRIGGLGVAISR